MSSLLSSLTFEAAALAGTRYPAWKHLKIGDPLVFECRSTTGPIVFFDQQFAIREYVNRLVFDLEYNPAPGGSCPNPNPNPTCPYHVRVPRKGGRVHISADSSHRKAAPK